MTDGTCRLCEDSYTKRGMTRHLDACLPAASGETTFHLRITGARRPEYWLHLTVAAATPLETLDSFLRECWVDCCNHLSAFVIGDDRYERPLDDTAPAVAPGSRQPMSASLDTVVTGDTEFTYQYDFGSTTELDVRVVDTGGWQPDSLGSATGHEGIALLARNEPPEYDCEVCSASATTICQRCLHDPAADAWLCEACGSDHEETCERPTLLPVVNSPRVGVCGYRGPATVESD